MRRALGFYAAIGWLLLSAAFTVARAFTVEASYSLKTSAGPMISASDFEDGKTTNVCVRFQCATLTDEELKEAAEMFVAAAKAHGQQVPAAPTCPPCPTCGFINGNMLHVTPN